jgi:MFS family permease
VALAVLAVQEADSVALGGLLMAALLAPSVLLAPLVGVALDRSRAPRLLVAGGAALSGAMLATAGLLGVLPPALVLLALLVAGCCSPVFMGGLSGFVAEVVPGEQRAFATDALSYNIAGVGGPAIAALLVTLANARGAVESLAALAVLGAVALVFLPLPARPQPESRGSVLGDIGRGTRYLVAHRPLAVATLSGTLTQIGSGGLAVVALALGVERAGSLDAAGWIVTAFSVGGLAGALLTAWRPIRRFDAPALMLGSFLGTGLGTLAAALLPGYPATLLAMGVAGLFVAPGVAAMLLIRQRESPPEVRSQIFTVGAGLRVSAAAIGAAGAGLLAGLGGTTLTVLMALVWIGSGAVMLMHPRNPVETRERAA